MFYKHYLESPVQTLNLLHLNLYVDDVLVDHFPLEVDGNRWVLSGNNNNK
ncbi:MAG: hypothetical protein KDD43_13430 [Bdellovibrionales bacterium]|nr:hypothetical protein [Bdellovibrionales bacterium]